MEGQPTAVDRPANRPPTQIISSLFSYNPKVDQPVDSASFKPLGKPSNAPLTDSSTFMGLGLDPLIVSHLSTKMKITKPTAIQRATLPTLLPRQPSPDDSPRDVFIQSQTGSGKTLSFLLPIIQDLLPLSSLSYIDRSIGTLAIIIVPTRELANQISGVLDTLLKLRLRPPDDPAEDSSSPRLTRWLVSGLLTGGATRTHEKARLRKGLPLLVSTPGRLLDHLQHTSAFNVGKCRWLVLDEADRLMELGFEETIQGIIKGLDGRRKLAKQAVQEGKSSEVGGWDWARQRRTILCSATIREDVQKLAGTTLNDPIVIKALDADAPISSDSKEQEQLTVAPSGQNFTPPSQLSQKYVIVPLKLRLVALISLLRTLLASAQNRKGTAKIIVFMSCTDSVDFHWNLFGNSAMDDNVDEETDSGSDVDIVVNSNAGEEKPGRGERVEVQSPLLPSTSIYRLHGSLPQPTRMASLRAFSSNKVTSSVLLCTSVASRGLDLPLVRAVVQYDLPTEGGATEYVHRVGRTARAGKGGEAWSFVSPSEKEWVSWVEGKMVGSGTKIGEGQNITLGSISVDSVLKRGFGGQGTEYEERATEVQLAFERWILRDQVIPIAPDGLQDAYTYFRMRKLHGEHSLHT
jgi:ATP-dependent RNA helicase DDX31/DBP7